MEKIHGKIDRQLKKRASFVVQSLRRTWMTWLNFVLVNARVNTDFNQELITNLEYARIASRNLLLTGTQNQSIVQTHAQRTHVIKIEKTEQLKIVYNLTVDEVPEYFANGILVHNCSDSVRYMTWHMRHNRDNY